MTSDSFNYEKLAELKNQVVQKFQEEQQSKGAQTIETLKYLNISIDELPQKCQQLLHTFASLQNEIFLEKYDPIATSLLSTQTTSELLEEEYEILLLKQDNAKLKKQIERNNKILEGLRKDLEISRKSIKEQNLNPDNIDDHIRQLKQKLTSYEEIYEMAKTKFSKLQIPENLLQSLSDLATQVTTLKQQEGELKLRADDITLARDALHKLRNV